MTVLFLSWFLKRKDKYSIVTFQNKIDKKSGAKKYSENKTASQKPRWLDIRGYVRAFLDRVKKLNGDPTYVAKGMAIGVFVGVTPTIPFHTALAFALAFIFKASKPAAITGVWFCNPVTLPLFYYGSYKVGAFLFHLKISADLKAMPITEILRLGAKVTAALVCGGIINGIPFGIAAFFITRSVFQRIQLRRKARQDRIAQSPGSNHDIT